MLRNCDKTHHVNKNALSKDSAFLSFFRLDKNYGRREYDTSNKVLANSLPRQSIDHIRIEPIIESATSVLNGKSVEVCCLYRNKVYNWMLV